MSLFKTKAEPRFDLDLKYGVEGERRIKAIFDAVAKGDGRVEVKRKRFIDDKLYVETHCDKGKRGVYEPSGINVTTARLWVFIVDDTGIHIAIPTAVLREAILDASCVDVSETDGDCPTRGKLLDLHVLLYRLNKYRKRMVTAVQEAVRPCMHKPEFIENGRCWICERLAAG